MKRLLLIAVGFLITFPVTASAQKPQSAKKYVKQGLERFGRNDIVGAIAEYDRALAIDPTQPDTVFAGTLSDSGDAFVSKLDSTGQMLVYSTYVGGRSLEKIALTIWGRR